MCEREIIIRREGKKEEKTLARARPRESRPHAPKRGFLLTMSVD
jgi:hypothetical protein